MKTIDELRKGFEETNAYKYSASEYIVFDGKDYSNSYPPMNEHCIFINGAWRMYQEQLNDLPNPPKHSHDKHYRWLCSRRTQVVRLHHPQHVR